MLRALVSAAGVLALQVAAVKVPRDPWGITVYAQGTVDSIRKISAVDSSFQLEGGW